MFDNDNYVKKSDVSITVGDTFDDLHGQITTYVAMATSRELIWHLINDVNAYVVHHANNYIAKISQNLDTCFRGETLKWWNSELDSITRRGLIHSTDVEDWCTALEKRFKLPPSQARQRLDNTCYTVADVIAKRPPSSYVASIVSLAKQCGEGETEFPLVLRAWRNLDMTLRESIDEPDEGTTVAQFIQTLNKKSTNWFDKFASSSMECPAWNFPWPVLSGRVVSDEILWRPELKRAVRNNVMEWSQVPNVIPPLLTLAAPRLAFLESKRTRYRSSLYSRAEVDGLEKDRSDGKGCSSGRDPPLCIMSIDLGIYQECITA
ncbi:uncharacterized protein P174DRAFT_471610 [Aspergillus novofumigatus IBT 16806]|uniref:Uncharacterized protein n=1 Tax=Aspergillus novofumigatus (strain IBT 16806) TaxID=1392255 RepID=A0A2I1BUF1_ASPN1|nr:uncharacterized protein P174DRAFT_471610 [Aspergillus novofumigatus IBT 16806]PKX89027.1 hypothetical protein P174DRAFT_471610 [Aspergillus novofumigatus IBT 16806]